MVKTMLRFYNGIPVRTIWDKGESKWWYSAEDVGRALIRSRNSKAYWAMLKRKDPKLNEIKRQLKMVESGELHITDLVDIGGVGKIAALTKSRDKSEFIEWAQSAGKMIDDKSKFKAYELFDCLGLEVGTSWGLRQIHKHVFDGIYKDAGDFRVIKIPYARIPRNYVGNNIDTIVEPPDKTLTDIVFKYVMMVCEKPFEHGSERSLRIWVDMLLRRRYNLCIDWSKVNKRTYEHAMSSAPADISSVRLLFRRAIGENVNNRELFMRSIDYSFYIDEESENDYCEL